MIFDKKCKICGSSFSSDKRATAYCSENCKTVFYNNRLKKTKETNLKKYGCENPYQNEEIKKKCRKIKKERYGDEHFVNVKKRQQTNLKKYGVSSYSKTKEYKNKCIKTSLEKYGTEYPMQSKDINKKSMVNACNFKEYILPSGKIVKIQGYENKALDELFKNGYKEEDVLMDRLDVPKIRYTDKNGKRRLYYPDIYIKSENKIIEVKSEYTYNYNLNTNLLKEKACINNGFNFEFKIYYK